MKASTRIERMFRMVTESEFSREYTLYHVLLIFMRLERPEYFPCAAGDFIRNMDLSHLPD